MTQSFIIYLPRLARVKIRIYFFLFGGWLGPQQMRWRHLASELKKKQNYVCI